VSIQSDATCLLVANAHVEVAKMRDQASEVVIAALKQRFPEIQGPKKDDICYATQNRQDAVKVLAGQCAPKEVPLGCDLVIVVGSPNSSNSRRLKEVAVARGIDGYLVDGSEEIDPVWLAGKQRIGVTAGASAPEILVQRVVDRIGALTGAEVWQLAGVEKGRVVSVAEGVGLARAEDAIFLE